jgi:ERCC4-type nuclease
MSFYAGVDTMTAMLQHVDADSDDDAEREPTADDDARPYHASSSSSSSSSSSFGLGGGPGQTKRNHDKDNIMQTSYQRLDDGSVYSPWEDDLLTLGMGMPERKGPVAVSKSSSSSSATGQAPQAGAQRPVPSELRGAERLKWMEKMTRQDLLDDGDTKMESKDETPLAVKKYAEILTMAWRNYLKPKPGGAKHVQTEPTMEDMAEIQVIAELQHRIALARGNQKGKCTAELVVDSAEQKLWPFVKHVPGVRRESLAPGDYHLRNRDEVYMAVERKGRRDFCSGIQDGRFREQRTRLDDCSIPNNQILYVIEDEPHLLLREHMLMHTDEAKAMHMLPYDTMATAMHNLRHLYGMQIYETRNLLGTVHMLCKDLETLTFHGQTIRADYVPCASCRAGAASAAGQGPAPSEPSRTVVNIKKVDKSDTPEARFVNGLVTMVHSLGEHKARCIARHYQTMAKMHQAYLALDTEAERRNMLTQVPLDKPVQTPSSIKAKQKREMTTGKPASTRKTPDRLTAAMSARVYESMFGVARESGGETKKPPSTKKPRASPKSKAKPSSVYLIAAQTALGLSPADAAGFSVDEAPSGSLSSSSSSSSFVPRSSSSSSSSSRPNMYRPVLDKDNAMDESDNVELEPGDLEAFLADDDEWVD